jgi:hypothetical protein
MIFCGQCGLQLAPGVTRCPRCGATVEEGTGTPTTEMNPDGATVASLSLNTHNPVNPSPISPPQPLILRPGADGNDYGSQIASDATSRVEAPHYGTQIPQNPTNMGSTYANNYPQPSGSSYHGQGSYSDFGTRAPGTYGGGGYPTNTQMGYQQPFAQEQPKPTNRIRITALVLVLIGVLLLLIAIILFALKQNNAIGTTPTHTPTAIISVISTTPFNNTQSGLQYYSKLE